MHYLYLATGIKYRCIGNSLLILPAFYIGARTAKSFEYDNYCTSSKSQSNGNCMFLCLQIIATKPDRQLLNNLECAILKWLKYKGLWSALENMHIPSIGFCTKGRPRTKKGEGGNSKNSQRQIFKQIAQAKIERGKFWANIGSSQTKNWFRQS